MTTWQNHSGESGAAVTTWNYHPQRGWFENKRYNDGTGPDYTYTAAGRLRTRTWARQVDGQDLVTTYTYNGAGDLRTTVYSDDTPDVAHAYDRLGRLKTTEDAAGTLTRGYTVAGALEFEDYTYTAADRLETRTWAREKNGQRLKTTYGYNAAGDLETVVYSDDTPDVAHAYDRLGRLKTSEDAAGTLTRGYTAADALEYEDYTGNGLLNGVSIDRGYDAMHRLRYLATDAGYGVTYLFDTAGRLSEIAESHHRADFGYEHGTEILDSVEIRRVGIERLRHERSTDKLGRIEWMKTVVDGQTEVRRDYTYNTANQRTTIEHEDGRTWHYGYDSLGQVQSASKQLSTNPTSSILPGYRFGYAFDDIGNRETATRNYRTANYTVNLLNQYEERTVPGFVDALGEAHATAIVMVDGQPTQRTGRDFRREITVANSSGAVYRSIEVEAEFDSQTVDETRHAFVPEDPEVFVHDADGNLISDGRWIYEWDGENRLKAIETLPAIVTVVPELNQRLEFAYDFQGRRIQKIVKEWDTGSATWQTAKDLRFVYDGWNLIEERDALNSDAIIRKYVWGPDLNGTMQGAGGICGLLWTQTRTQTFAASSDANGNVVGWINTATLAVAGRLDYSPFGEPVMQTGVARELPFGFSTKYEDVEAGLLYYGYRYLDPSTGEWISRDPIEERGELNLYGIVGNDAINRIDFLGLYTLLFKEGWPPHADLVSMYSSGYLPNGTAWNLGEIDVVKDAQAGAILRGIFLPVIIDQFIDEIPELYCETYGRDQLLREVKYTRETTSLAINVLRSSRNLAVGKASGPGFAFVTPIKNLYVTGDFFTSGAVERAATFFHETTHILGRTPGDDGEQDSSLEDLIKSRGNMNSTTFATLCTNRLQEYHPPLASFSIGPDGIIDSNGNLIYVMRFLDGYDYDDIKLNRLGRVYSFAVWTVGLNRINEYGGGDDHFIGKRRDGEIDVRFSKRN